MKKVFVAVAMVFVWGVNVAMAQDMNQDLNLAAPVEMTLQTDWTEFMAIEVTEVPLAVSQAVMEAYGTCIKEAYVSMSDEGLTFKLVLTSEEVEGTVVYLNEHGDFLM